MEVQCERCQTEYDFDDALVSERGTTVKCTHCGHQFRIFRPKAASSAPERWEVRTRSGQEFNFNSLRELQRAITRGLVERDDTLIRAGLAPKVLSTIAELEPFFPSTVNRSVPPVPSRAGGEGSGATLAAMPPPVAPPVLPVPTPPPASAAHIRTLPGGTSAPMKPPESLPQDVLAMDRESEPTRRVKGLAALAEEPPFDPATVRRRPGSSGEESRALPPVEPKPPIKPASAQVEAQQEVVIREKPDINYTPTPSDIRAAYVGGEEGRPEPRFVPEPKRGSAAVRWVIALVVVGVVVVAGVTLGRRHLGAQPTGTSAATVQDPRVAELLRDGEKKLLAGDLEGAKESFDKASALAESDVRVQVQRARWANVKADLSWLKLRLLAPDQADALTIARRELEDSSRRASELATKAHGTASQDAAAVRVRIDAYRLAGDLAAARKLVPQLPAGAADPEVAYVLAALELAEQSPSWPTVIDRLRVAAAGEQNLGRARGALVYALAASGQPAVAQAELDALSKAPRPYPLLLEARAFVARVPAVADAGVVGDGGVDPSTLPLVAGGGTGGEPGESIAGTYQDLLARAHAAHSSGDLARAEQLYRAVLARNPQDTEALSGLGDIARSRGDKTASLKYYEDVQKQNPGYLPALVGMADAKWDAGDKAGAVALYKQILDKTGGQGPYADKARQRIASASQGAGTPAASAAPPPATASSPPPAATPTATGTPAPTSTAPPPAGVDTSDLPGWKP